MKKELSRRSEEKKGKRRRGELKGLYKHRSRTPKRNEKALGVWSSWDDLVVNRLIIERWDVFVRKEASFGVSLHGHDGQVVLVRAVVRTVSAVKFQSNFYFLLIRADLWVLPSKSPPPAPSLCD